MAINVFTDQAELVTISVEKSGVGMVDMTVGDVRLAAEASDPLALAVLDKAESVELVLDTPPDGFPDLLGEADLFGTEVLCIWYEISICQTQRERLRRLPRISKQSQNW